MIFMKTSTLFAVAGIALGQVLWAHALPIPADSPAAESPPEGQELSRDDGTPVGKRSMAGSGHVVKFEAPSKGCTLVAVKLYGSRYGTPTPPNENANIYLCDENLKTIATFPVPYSKFIRGEPKWYTIPVKATNLPPKFVICAAFKPTATKGVYVHHDASGSGSSSMGLPGGTVAGFEKGDWMIRAVVRPAHK